MSLQVTLAVWQRSARPTVRKHYKNSLKRRYQAPQARAAPKEFRSSEAGTVGKPTASPPPNRKRRSDPMWSPAVSTWFVKRQANGPTSSTQSRLPFWIPPGGQAHRPAPTIRFTKPIQNRRLRKNTTQNVGATLCGRPPDRRAL